MVLERNEVDMSAHTVAWYLYHASQTRVFSSNTAVCTPPIPHFHRGPRSVVCCVCHHRHHHRRRCRHHHRHQLEPNVIETVACPTVSPAKLSSAFARSPWVFQNDVVKELTRGDHSLENLEQPVLVSWINLVTSEIVFFLTFVSPWCECALFFSLFFYSSRPVCTESGWLQEALVPHPSIGIGGAGGGEDEGRTESSRNAAVVMAFHVFQHVFECNSTDEIVLTLLSLRRRKRSSATGRMRWKITRLVLEPVPLRTSDSDASWCYVVRKMGSVSVSTVAKETRMLVECKINGRG